MNFSAFKMNELCSPVSDISKTLNNHSLIFKSSSKTTFLIERWNTHQFFNGKENSQTSRLCSTGYSTLTNVLSCAACFTIDIFLSHQTLIGIEDPSHDLFISSKIRAQTIDTSSNKTFFDKFNCVSSCDSLEFSLRAFSWINLDSSFGTPKRNISN